jgi:cell division protein FtsW
LGSRIENFSTDKPDEDDYQIEKAKIANLENLWLGPGKSVQKNFCHNPRLILFMIIVEEYLIGGFGVLILYLLLLFRFVVASHKANTLLES